MATQLKNLKFSDYTLKGETDSSGTRFVLGGSDSFGYMETLPEGGSSEYHPIVDHSWVLGCSNVWYFHGGADYAGCASRVDVNEGGTVQGKHLYGKTIPTFNKGGSSATVKELEDWINTFVNEFSGGSAYVIT